MEARADRLAAEEQELAEAVEMARAALDAAKEQLAAGEEAAAEAERAHMAAVRAIADRREGLARLSGQVDTLRTRADSVDAEVSRLTVAIEEARARGDAAQAEFEVVQDEIGDLDAGRSDSTPTTSEPSKRCAWSPSVSPNCRAPNARQVRKWHRFAPGSTPCLWDSNAKTGQAGSSRIAAMTALRERSVASSP